ncbi:hypothetical protein NIES4075_69820 [Tolypothrix sp. NIES-4075]|nr:hypothetical protein NIES4075_69820 [Tolypothrix sp. NIES-4075]
MIYKGRSQYFPTLTQASLKPSTRFFSTVLIEAFDHKLMAMPQATKKADKIFMVQLLSMWLSYNRVTFSGMPGSKKLLALFLVQSSGYFELGESL